MIQKEIYIFSKLLISLHAVRTYCAESHFEKDKLASNLPHTQSSRHNRHYYYDYFEHKPHLLTSFQSIDLSDNFPRNGSYHSQSCL